MSWRDLGYLAPFPDYQQAGSFLQPLATPSAGPTDGTQVCIPINADWVPILLGCLSQLRNPSSWAAADDTTVLRCMQWYDNLREAVANATACVAPMSYSLRFQDCQLQYSTGGETWTEVPGWADFPSCLPGYQQQAIALPSNPQGVSTTQQACNIAGFVSQQMIQQIINVLKTDISTGQTVTQFLINLTAGGLLFLKVFPITGAVLLAVDALFTWAGSLASSDLTAIAADAVLWEDVTCAIYSAIQTDGRITASNWPTAVSNIRAISYSIPGVAGALADFAGSLDMTTVYEWQQLAPIDSVDCSGCLPAWCLAYDFSAGPLGWEATGAGSTTGFWAVSGGRGYWFSGTASGYTAFDIQLPLSSPVHMTSVEIIGYMGAGATDPGYRQVVDYTGHGNVNWSTASGVIDVVVPWSYYATGVRVIANSLSSGGSDIEKIVLRGYGTPPPTGLAAVCT